MKNLKSFILGMLTILLFIPIVEQITDVLVTGLEYIKGLISKPVLKINKDLLDLQAQQEPIATHAVGFQSHGDDEFYDDFDDYEY